MMSDQETNIAEKLKYSRGDNIHSAITVGLGSIPVLGSMAAAFFERVIVSPNSKRVASLFSDIFQHLQTLEQKYEELKIDNLPLNEAFVSQVTQVLQIATVHHERERLEALRNSALNVAIHEVPDESRQKIFTQWLSELTIWHWKILRVFDDPRIQDVALALDDNRWTINIGLVHLFDIIETIYPEIRGDYDLVIQVLRDLYARGLIANALPHSTGGASHSSYPQLTPIAKEFLAFIKHPLDS
jgi:hypothetical protein